MTDDEEEHEDPGKDAIAKTLGRLRHTTQKSGIVKNTSTSSLVLFFLSTSLIASRRDDGISKLTSSKMASNLSDCRASSKRWLSSLPASPDAKTYYWLASWTRFAMTAALYFRPAAVSWIPSREIHFLG